MESLHNPNAKINRMKRMNKKINESNKQRKNKRNNPQINQGKTIASEKQWTAPLSVLLFTLMRGKIVIA